MIIGLFLTIIALHECTKKRWGLSISYAALVWCGWIYALTETLSVFNLLGTPAILAFTSVYDLIWIAVIVIKNKKVKDSSFFGSIRSLLGIAENRKLFIGLLILGFLILALSQIMTIYHPDSLNYHLPRILMWYRNRSVAHFATSDTRMIGSPPLKEFVDLWIYSIWGRIHEQMMNLTQWAAYIVNILMVYSIAGYVGCRGKWRLLAAFVYAATPIAMVEAFTTQNDEFAAMFVLVFVVVVLEFTQDPDSLKFGRNAIIRYASLIASISFIYLSKPSGMFAVLVFAVWLVVSCIKRGDKVFSVIKWLFAVAIGSAVIILPELVRNLITYGRITDPWQGPGQLALTADPRLLFINFLKNVGNNIIHVVWFWLGKVWVYVVYALAKLLHVNADNELISEFGQAFQLRTIPVYQFDFNPNVILTVFLLILCVAGIIRLIKKLIRREFKDIEFSYTVASVISALLIFLFVKWEPFSARYFIAYLGLLAPILGLKLQKLDAGNELDRKRKFNTKNIISFVIVAIGVLDICAVIMFQGFYFTKQLPLTDKGRGYYVFSAEATYENQYLALSNELKDYSSIGIVVNGEQWVYVAMKLIEEHNDDMRFVLAPNDSKQYESESFHPEAILFLGSVPSDYQVSFVYNDHSYNEPEKISDVCAVSYQSN